MQTYSCICFLNLVWPSLLPASEPVGNSGLKGALGKHANNRNCLFANKSIRSNRFRRLGLSFRGRSPSPVRKIGISPDLCALDRVGLLKGSGNIFILFVHLKPASSMTIRKLYFYLQALLAHPANLVKRIRPSCL